VREYYALGLAGAARGIKNADDVRVDHPVARHCRCIEQGRASEDIQAANSRQRFRRIENHDMAQVVAGRKCFLQQGQALRGGDQHADIAVTQDVADLFGLEQRVERHENATSRRCAKAGDHRFETLFEVDGDALATLV
jgi:hypothetical protein